MIYLFHGPDLNFLLEHLLNLEKTLNFNNKIELNLNEVSFNDLPTFLKQKDIFSEFPLFKIELFEKLSNQDSQVLTETLISSYLDQNIILFSFKMQLDFAEHLQTACSKLKIKIEVKQFTEKADFEIFNFLDALFLKNRTVAYKHYVNLLNNSVDDSYIFSMLLYQLRNVYACKKSFTKFNKLKPMVISKVTKQAALFSESFLSNFYLYLYTLDKKVKTGSLKFDIALTLAIEKILA